MNAAKQPAHELPTRLEELLRALYAHFNAALFKGALPPAVIKVQAEAASGGGRRGFSVLGFYSAGRWKVDDENFDEITLTAERMNDAPEQIATTLLHEMIHAYNRRVTKKRDTSANGYHLHRVFGREAEKRGLRVEYVRGFPGVNTPGLSAAGRKAFLAFWAARGEDPAELSRAYRLGWAGLPLLPPADKPAGPDSDDEDDPAPVEKPAKPAPKLRPWTCDCGLRLWVAAKTDLQARCERCGALFTRADEP